MASLHSALAARARLVATAGAVGAVLGVVAVLGAIAASYDPAGAVETVFALGALCLGFGTMGWSGSVFVGPAVESAQEHLDSVSGWTEADSRRAMARIAGFGAGVMVAAAVAEYPLT